MKTIYALIDPRDSRVHYIGRTASALTRHSAHIDEAYSKRGWDKPKNIWLRDVISNGYMPIWIDLECSHDLVADDEIMWIKLLTSMGSPLKNIHPYNRDMRRSDFEYIKKYLNADLSHMEVPSKK